MTTRLGGGGTADDVPRPSAGAGDDDPDGVGDDHPDAGRRRGPDGFWLPPWGSTGRPTGPPPGPVEVDVTPGFRDALAAARDSAADRPAWVGVYGLAAAGLVVGAMTSGTAGAVVGLVAGPVVGLAAFRLVVRPWHRSRLRSRWSFTAEGVEERVTLPGAGAPSVHNVHPWPRADLVVRDGRLLVRRDDTPTAALPLQSFTPDALALVLERAAAADVGAAMPDRRARGRRPAAGSP